MNLPNAVVTGAAGGIGQAIVQAFSEAGPTAIATHVVPQPARLAYALYLQVGLARTVQDEAYAADVFARIHARTGSDGLNALSNKGTLQILGSVDGLTRADWQQASQVDLLAPFIWTQALLAALEAARGSVVNISSGPRPAEEEELRGLSHQQGGAKRHDEGDGRGPVRSGAGERDRTCRYRHGHAERGVHRPTARLGRPRGLPRGGPNRPAG